MVNYQTGKIYKIVCNTTGKTYVGSTCQCSLAKRLSGHLRDFNCWKNKTTTKYMTSFDLLENNNYVICLVESYPCNSKDELHSRERFHIESIECVNNRIPCRTHAQYYEDNKVNILKKVKQYYEENKDKKLEYAKEYINSHQDKIKNDKIKYYEDNKERIKLYKAEYHQKNRDKRIQYYEEHKDEINAKRREKRKELRQRKSSISI